MINNNNYNIQKADLRYSDFFSINHQSPIINHQSSILLLMCLIFFAGCSNAHLRDARKAFYNNQPQKAAETLSQAKSFSKRDKLLLFMEKGLILHHMGEYGESIKELRQASALMERQGVISVSRQTVSLVTTDWITEYKGEYAERLWVHTYLMMNYLIIRKHESALVEAKQALKILDSHPEPLSNDYFTRALIALCFDNLHEINDAYIEYKKLAKLMPDKSQAASDIYRLGLQLGFADEAEQYKKYLPKHKLSMLNKGPSAELVLFAGTGSGPVKIPDNVVVPPSIRFSLPRYQERDTGYTKITVRDSVTGYLPVAADITTNINRVAKASLEDRAAKLIAKETARVAAKEAITQAVTRKNNSEVLEVLIRAAFFLLEEPDTRCWETLPASLKLLRVPLRPGRKYNLRVAAFSGGVVNEVTLPEIMLNPGQRVYHSLRINN
ncbi:MAG: hypothetical protein GY795_50020 [Desulfobacterales bacterium]|nr:hypothetical protein [Desulfobacterales bacterium]